MIRYLPWVTLLIFATVACSPVYTTRDVFHPPEHSEGLICIQECGDEEQLCQSDCASQQRACEYDARDRAKVEFNHAVDEYSRETERYAINLRDYHERMRDHERELRRLERDLEAMERRCASDDKAACGSAKSLDKRIDRLAAPYEPDEPQRPLLADFESSELAKCDFTCGCQEAFKRCYLSCGGQVTQVRECIDHCD
jgi:hypothetical protein